MRTDQESNAINRVLKARGMPTLDQPGVIAALAYQVEDHQHFTELLRACDPQLRREMYEAMRPNLRFIAKPLEDYIIAAKEHAEAAELPVMDTQGFLHAYSHVTVRAEVPEVQLLAQCSRCDKGTIFFGARKADAIHNMRSAGWAFDESSQANHICEECLEEVPDAMDPQAS